jgi:hypothetical protein
MKTIKTYALALLTAFLVSISVQAQTKLPATAKLADDNGRQQIYLNVESAPNEEDMGGVTSVWLYDKQQRSAKRLLTSNSMAEGAWDRMANHQAASVMLDKIAAADRARFVVGESKIIVEGCPDARNIYSYLIDLEQNTACQLPSNSGLVGFCGEDENYIVMSSYRYHPDPEVGGRFPVLSVYDTNGKFVKELEVR